MYCKNMIFPVLIERFVDMEKALLYWFEGQGVNLEQ